MLRVRSITPFALQATTSPFSASRITPEKEASANARSNSFCKSVWRDCPCKPDSDTSSKIKRKKVNFSTAYDQYAVNAFELNAVDYLLKPYTRERFDRAIQRILDQSHRPLEQLHALAENLMKKGQPDYPNRILVSSGQKLIAIATESIIWINADGDYSQMITEQQSYLSNYGIGQLEEKLDPKLFLRVHRSSIINISKVKELFKYPAAYDIRMVNGDVVRVSRSYLEKIRNLTF